MKKKIEELKLMHHLPRNTKLNSECMYLLNSESTGQSLYFETKRDIIYAHNQIKKHLSPVMDIVDYLFSPDGWAIVVVIQDDKTILNHYKKKQKKSTIITQAIREKNIAVLLSENIRHAIASIAKYSNRSNSRQGTVVKGNFSRYIFKDVASAKEFMQLMKAEQINLCQQHKRYRPSRKLWDKLGEIDKSGDVFLCTRKMRESEFTGGEESLLIKIIQKCDDVLRHIIFTSFYHHFPRFSPKKYPSPMKS